MVSDDMGALEKIKQAKELYEMGAISENEFNEIKKASLKQINDSKVKHKHTPITATDYNTSSKTTEDVAREVTKGIMRGICDKMENESNGNYDSSQLPSSDSNTDIITRTIISNVLENEPTVVRQKSTRVTKVSSDNENVLDEDLIKKIEDNLDDVCRIFSIPKMGKKFVINKLSSEFSSDEISDRLDEYLNKSNEKSSILKRVEYKNKLIEDNIKPIPEEHFKLYFILHDSKFKSKKKFIEHMKTYWNPNNINSFYDEYQDLLKNGIQKQQFEKIMVYDIKKTCEIFSISSSILGNRFVFNKIFNNYSEHEIKEKLNNYFKLSEDYLNKNPVKKIDVPEYEPPEIKSNLSSQPDYYRYKVRIKTLKSQFVKKEQQCYDLIEKCFPAPQMTNSKFNAMVDECSRVFTNKSESTLLIIESTDEYSDRLENEIISDIDILETINDKLDSLNDELLIIQSKSNKDDVDFLFDEMDDLIFTVKDYKRD